MTLEQALQKAKIEEGATHKLQLSSNYIRVYRCIDGVWQSKGIGMFSVGWGNLQNNKLPNDTQLI